MNFGEFFFFSEIEEEKTELANHLRGALFVLLPPFVLWFFSYFGDVESSRAARCHGRCHGVGSVELAEKSDSRDNDDSDNDGADSNAVVGNASARFEQPRQRRRQRLRQGLLWSIDVDRLQGRIDSRRARRARRERQGRGNVDQLFSILARRRKRRRRRSRRPRSRSRPRRQRNDLIFSSSPSNRRRRQELQ